LKALTRGLLAFAVTLALSAPLAWAQAPAAKPPAPADKPAAAAPADNPGVVLADVTAINASVEAVDKDKRTVTLNGPRGRTVTLKVGPNAKNFDQVKVGDTLKVRYLESIALFVRKPGEPADAAETQAVSVAPKGKKPAGIAVSTVEISAKVEKINYDKRLLTLKGPEGNVRTIKVDPRVKRLGEVKVGDDIVLRYTEAVAIQVTPPKS
jgi:ribosomal 50S subunit-recycling heat shock protein